MAKFKDLQQAGANVVSSLTRPATSGQAAAAQGSVARAYEGRAQMREACTLRLDRIVADPAQPRKEFDSQELADLAASLRERGLLQAIRVRYDSQSDQYIIVCGERRWRAAAMAGLEKIPCIVADAPATPEEVLEDQLVENALRADLKPIESAHAYRRLLESLGISQRQLAERLHISPQTITRALALLELPEDVQHDVDAGTIAPETAYEIGRVADDSERQELVTKARTGTLRREEVREKATRARRKRSTDSARSAPITMGGTRSDPVEVRVDGAVVTIALQREGVDPITALEQAIHLLRSAAEQTEVGRSTWSANSTAQIVAETSDEVQAA